MNTLIEQRNREIELIELSPEEKDKAIWSYKVGKWNYEKNKEYWQDLESRTPEAGETGLRANTGKQVKANE